MNEKVSLGSVNSGAAVDLFDLALEAVLANIGDANTSPTASRKIVLTLSIKPTEDRSQAVTSVDVKTTLAPAKPNSGMVVFSSDGTKISAFPVGGLRQPELGEGVIPFAANGTR